MADHIRWGILGTGAIAKKFAEDLQLLPDAKLVAVGSRSRATADGFGKQFNVPHRHDNYEGLASNADVDCVYIASPHPFHYEHSLLCLNAGKPVLCEKPFTINTAQAEELVALARGKKLLLMEAMWTRCFPLMQLLRQRLQESVVGELHLLTADFGFHADFDAKGRLFDPHLGGGALLDVGVYPVSLASMIFGAPEVVSGVAVVGQTGVDEQAAITLRYPRGQLAILYTSIRATTVCEAIITGARGRIRIHPPFWKPAKITITRDGRRDEVMEVPYRGHGYHFEAVEFMNCLRDGTTESGVMTLDESVSILRTLDQLRQQFGVKYPME